MIPYIKEAAQPNNDIAIWFHPDEPDLVAYNNYQKEYGNDRIITISFEDSTGILQPANVLMIHNLSQDLRALPGVISVESITSAKDFQRIEEDGVVRIKFAKALNPDSLFSISKKQKGQILTSPLLVNRYINLSGDAALIAVRQSPDQHTDSLINAIERLSDLHLKSDFYLNGIDVIVKHLNEQSEHDFKVFSGASYLVMFLVVWLFMRNVRYLLYVVITSVLTLLFSLAIYGWLGFHLNVFTVMTPPLLIILSIINSLHVINSYESNEPDQHPGYTIIKSLKKLSTPLLFALLTTSLGFLSLVTSEAIVLQEFGVFAALGACFGYSLPVLVGLVILPFSKHKPKSSNTITGSFVTSCCRSVMMHSWKYATGIIAVIIISVIGLLRLQTDMYPIDYFPDYHPVQQTNTFMINHWGNYFPFELLIKAEEPGQMSSVEAVRSIHKFEAVVLQDPGVGTTFTYVTLIQRYCEVAFKKDLNEVLQDPFRAKKFIDQFVKTLQADSAHLLNGNLTEARFLLTGKATGNKELSHKLDKIHAIGNETLDQHLTISLIGYQALFIKAMKYAFNTMRSSLLWSFLLIFAMIWIMLRDFRLALIAIIPNLLPVLVLLGYMGLRNIDLDLATCTVSAIFLGIAVDDTIHILHRYSYLRKQYSKLEAIRISYDEVGQVFARTNLILVIGFSVLLAANLKTIVYLGELAMVASVSAFIGDLVLTPLLLKFFHKV